MHLRLTRTRAVILTSVVACAALAVCFRSVWLSQLGHILVAPSDRSGAPSAAEVVLVPNAGDPDPEMGRARLERAAALVREHRAGSIVMTCAPFYGVSVCDLASEALKRWGYSEVTLRPLGVTHMPDTAEAQVILSRCKQAGTQTAFILLPNYRTRRLGRVYTKLAQNIGMRITVIGYPSGDFDPDSWWRSRETQKIFFDEALRWAHLF